MKTVRNAVAVTGGLWLLSFIPLSSPAMDVGDPIYANDVPGKGRIEFIYEKYDRDATIEIDDITVAGMGEVVTVASDEEDTVGADTSMYVARGTWLFSDTVAIYGDIGFGDKEVGFLEDYDADDMPVALGAGIRALAYKKDIMRLTVFGSGRYVLPYDTTLEDLDEDLGREEGTAETDYFELTGGALVSANIAMDDKTVLVPYGGVAVSILRGQIDIDLDFPDAGLSSTGSADIEEDDAFELILGSTLIFQERWSVRAEGRLIGDASFSAGVGASF